MSENHKEDSLLDEFLDRASPVSAAYRDASREQAPQALDDAILAASRRQLRSRPRRLGWASRWGAPLAAAAVVTLTVAVVLRVQQEEPAPPQENEPAVRQAAPLADGKSESQQEDRDAGSSPAAERKAPPAALAKQRSAPPSAPASDEPASAQKKTESAALAARSEVPEARTDRTSPGEAADSASSSMLRSKEGPAATEQSRFAGAPAPAKPDTEAELANSRRAEEAVRDMQSSGSPAALSAPASPSPSQLLKEIDHLYAESRTAEGDHALREFCRRFPQHPMPASLGPQAQRLQLSCSPPRGNQP